MPIENPVLLQLTGMRSSKFGAMENYLTALIRSCEERRVRTVIQYESLPESAEYLATLTQLGVELVVVPTATRSPSTLRNVLGLMKRVRPTIIQTHFSARHVVATAAIFGRFAGARRVVSMVHNVHGLKARSLARFAYNRCDRVLAVSDGVRRDLLAGNVNPQILETHYMGLFGDRAVSADLRSQVRRDHQIPPDAVVIGNISFDAPFKGLDVLMQAMSRLTAGNTDVHLLQIGVDPAASSLPSLAQSLGISDRVHWAGIRDAGWRLLSGADLYVQSSRYGEGLPLAIMEAMAMGLPVVATRVSGNVEAVEDGVTGVVAEPDDAESLAAALSVVVTNPQHWPDFGAAARARYARLFDGPASVARLRDCLIADILPPSSSEQNSPAESRQRH